MIEVYDKTRKKVAILQNAFNIERQSRINAVYYLSFSLPSFDYKVNFCEPFHFVRWKNILYRIVSISYKKSDTGEIVYQCEHAIATLMDNVLFGYHVVGNLGVYTADVIRYVLSKQTTLHWVLDRCDFARQFEYGWEQENLLAALFSIPNRFVEKYIWKFDTERYPWRISLLKIDETQKPQFYVRDQKNMLSIAKQSDLKNVCTRLYPLGSGEGINQLNIKNINGGLPYLQSPQKYLDKYGLIERVWIDRRYEDVESLKSAAEVMLNELQEPYIEYQIDVAQLQGGDFDVPDVGKNVEVIDTDSGEKFKTYIVEINESEGDTSQCTVNIANRPQDIASTVADLADRQRIEMAYSQGATQIYSQSLQINADATGGAVMDFYIPEDMRFVNKVIVKIRMSSFRAYSKATKGGGGSSTTSGASSSTTTSSGGGGSSTSGSSSSSTTSSGGNFTTSDYIGDTPMTSNTAIANVSKAPSSHRHTYTVHLLKHAHQAKAHSHGMSHTHSVSIGTHSHGMSHTHSFSIPEHTHNITPGIYRFGSANSFGLSINGQPRGTWNTSSLELDVTSMLINNEGKISRGNWQELEVIPNDLAFISIVMVVQGFIQSRGDMTV